MRYTAKQSPYIVYEFFERPINKKLTSFYQKVLCSYEIDYFSLTELMVSHDLLRLMVTNQTEFDPRDSSSILKFERAIDRRYRALVFKLETPDTVTFTYTSFHHSAHNTIVIHST